jgi:NADH-quinone oxidoreductase subunit F
MRLGDGSEQGDEGLCAGGGYQEHGLVEVPIGTPLGELIYDIGGGIKGGKKYKAAQIGGPSGGCIPKEYLNVALDYKTLEELGAIMGSGGLIVMDEDSCMVDVARFFLDFVQDESCGKCVPCRVGTKRMLEILERICVGEGEEGDVEKLIRPWNADQGNLPLRSGPDCPQSCPFHDPAFPEGIRPAYPREALRSGCLSVSGTGLLPNGVSRRSGCSGFCVARGGEALRGGAQTSPGTESFRRGLRSRFVFILAKTNAAGRVWMTPVSIRGIKRFMVDQEVVIQVPRGSPK